MWFFLLNAPAATIDACDPTCDQDEVESDFNAMNGGDILEVDQPGTYDGGFQVGYQTRTIRGTVEGVVIDLEATYGSGHLILENVIVDCSALGGLTNAGTNNLASGGALTIRWSEIRNCSGTEGGFLRVQGNGTLTVEDSWIHDVTASGDGGFAFFTGGARGHLRRNLVCGGNAAKGGVFYLNSGAAQNASMVNNLFLDNTAVEGGTLYTDIAIDVRQNTAVFGDSDNEKGGSWGTNSGNGVDFVANLTAHTVDGDGLAPNDPEGSFQRNGYWNNDDADVKPGNSRGSFAIFDEDPGFPTTYAGCDPHPYRLGPGAGDLLDGNGSGDEVGAFGADAPGAWNDDDGDGQMAIWDCDDGDPLTYRGAPESCDGLDNDCDGEVDETGATLFLDADGDGYGDPNNFVSGVCQAGYVGNDLDCNDADATVNPDATEVCNTVDDDCDGMVDEGVQNTFYRDADSDGFGNDADSVDACTAPSGYQGDSGDCNDARPDVYPGAPELCDGLDNDCAGGIDDGLVFDSWYDDFDGDTYGDPVTVQSLCEDPLDGRIQDGTDCDDSLASVNPGAPEACDGLDTDCSGAPDANEVDVDGDSYLACAECDDGAPAVNPGAAEVCNGIDDNCDTQVDEGQVFVDYWPDGDGDGFGDENANATSACQQPPGTAADGTDCNDTNPSIFPGQTEACDSIDNDCDGMVDEDTSVQDWFLDGDGDGYGAGGATSQCNPPSGAHVLQSGDCDDGDSAVSPGTVEICDGLDQDCDGVADDGLATTDFYPDADNDGFGAEGGTPIADCAQPPGTSAFATDCDDTDAASSPGLSELCNGIDDDCTGVADDGLAQQSHYDDLDGDGYGDPASFAQDCAVPSGRVAIAQDCDDTDPALNPDAVELCDGIDNDCDLLVDLDDGLAPIDLWLDTDADGYGPEGAPDLVDCEVLPGFATQDGDCDDAQPSMYPGAPEQCDGLDNDCNGVADDNTVTSRWYDDADGDGYGDPALFVDLCNQPTNTVLNDLDCDDADAAIQPDADEICDGIDNDCDGDIDDADTDLVDDGVASDTYFPDADFDGFGAIGSPGTVFCVDDVDLGFAPVRQDCDDADFTVNPGGIESCVDGIDNDCDGLVDGADPDFQPGGTLYWNDADGDGFGNPTDTIQACEPSGTYVTPSGAADCNDADNTVNPGAPDDFCDGIDHDCDGVPNDEAAIGDFWPDADSDGFGDASAAPTAQCNPDLTMWVDNGDDCADSDASINPAAVEDCEGLDRDCDGDPSNGVVFVDYYLDADGDGHGGQTVTAACDGLPADHTESSTDCNDDAASVNPDATEACNGIDDDCDGEIDDGLDGEPAWLDQDGDGFGTGEAEALCALPGGYSRVDGDCDDGDVAVFPGAEEILADGIDQDCDGVDATGGKGGCRCQSTPAPVQPVVLLGLMITALRRRSKGRSVAV